MIANFIKPNPLSPQTINETDKGVLFLKALKQQGLIDYDDEALNHVNTWYIDDPPTIKRWFDTLHEPLLVRLSDSYLRPQKNPQKNTIIAHRIWLMKIWDIIFDIAIIDKVWIPIVVTIVAAILLKILGVV